MATLSNLLPQNSTSNPLIVTAQKAVNDLTKIRDTMLSAKNGLTTQQNNLLNQPNIPTITPAKTAVGETPTQYDLNTKIYSPQQTSSTFYSKNNELTNQPEYYNDAGQKVVSLPTGAKIQPLDGGNDFVYGEPTRAFNRELNNIQTQRNAIQTQLESAANDYVTQVRGGNFPLTAKQQALVNNTNAMFEKLKNEQLIANQALTAITGQAGIRSGRNMYAPEINAGEIKATVDQGLQKIADIDLRRVDAINNMEVGFKQKNYEMVKDAYLVYEQSLKDKNNSLKEIQTQIQKNLQSVQDANELMEKEQFERVTKPIQDIQLLAAKSFAPLEIQQRIANSQSVGEAIAMAGDYLSNAPGEIGEFLSYQRITGSPISYEEWGDLKQEKIVNQKYAEAFATAKGRAAGTPDKPLAISIDGDMVTSQFTPTQIRQIDGSSEAKKLKSIQDLIGKLNAYKEVVNQPGGFDIIGSRKSILDSLYADLKIAYKEAANLGALTGPDVAIIQEAIKPAAGIQNLPGYLTGGLQKGVIASIDQARETAFRQAKNNFDSLISRYGSSDPYIQSLGTVLTENIDLNTKDNPLNIKFNINGETSLNNPLGL